MRGYERRQFVYFARLPDGLIKIGSTGDVPARMKSLKGELIHLIEGSSFRETAVHFLLRDARLKGEIFDDGDIVRDFIAKSKVGDYCGLISDIPKLSIIAQPDPVRHRPGVDRPFRMMREAIGFSIDDVSELAGVSINTAACADSQTAPIFLSGRMAQAIITEVRSRGAFVDSHHLTGLYQGELKYLIGGLKARSARSSAVVLDELNGGTIQ